MSKADSAPFDAPMTDEQTEMAEKLSSSDLGVIDDLLIENIGDEWIKSSFLIGGVMLKVPDEYEDLPDVFYSTRLALFEQQGLIEVKGDLKKMKHCEIRIP